MISYKETKEILNDILKDKIMKWIARITFSTLLLILIYGAFRVFWPNKNSRPFNLYWGLLKTEKIDTVTTIQHDTIYKTVIQYVPKKSNLESIKQKGGINVASENQQGGQTAAQINN